MSSAVLDRFQDPAFRAWVKENVPEEERPRYAPFMGEQIIRKEIEKDWEPWARSIFPGPTSAPFADYHREMWKWSWEVQPGIRPKPLVAVVFRGGAKSTTAEMCTVVMGATERRRYCLYVSRTQDQADEHVDAISSLLESPEMASAYPGMSQRKLDKFGNAKGWRRNRLVTATGFVVDAIGLDTAGRGKKLDFQRPDLIILDDIDDTEDSPKVVRKLIRLITKKLIPAGSKDVAIMFVQNLIHANGVMARLISGTADFLRRRRVIGPIPAIENLRIEHNDDNTLTVLGDPTWEGFGLADAEALANEIGEQAFREECQHDVARVEGAKWSREQIAAMRVSSHPDLTYIDVGVDPSGGDGPENDEQGIIVTGIDDQGILYVLKDLSGKRSEHAWGNTVIRAWVNHDADLVIGESNYGGDMVEGTVRNAAERNGIKFPKKAYEDAHATRGKIRRIGPVAAWCGDPEDPETWANSRIKLVGSFPELEEEMATFNDDASWSPNRLDALVWCATYRIVKEQKKRPRASMREDDEANDDVFEALEKLEDI